MRATVAHATTKDGEEVRGIAVLIRQTEGDLSGYEKVVAFVDHQGRMIAGDDLVTKSCFAECGCFEHDIT